MDTNEKTLLLVKAQSNLLLHMAERLVILQVAFEAFAREQIEQSGDLAAHYKTRQEMFQEDFAGKTTDLLNTLKSALRQVDN